MLIWINGAFGVGKTAVASALREQWPRARIFDPEDIGFVLRRVVPGALNADYQDLRLWRVLTRRTAMIAARFAAPLIVPMTICQPRYFEEIVGGLRRAHIDVRHFTLKAPRAVVLQRLALRGDDASWAARQFDRCAATLALPAFAHHIDTVGRAASELAVEIHDRVYGVY